MHPAIRRITALIALLLPALSTPLAVAEPISFNRDVRPILSDRCFHCHGPDAGNRKAGLRLDERDAAMGETDSGLAAIAPGHPDQSEVMRRLLSSDPGERMPPAKSKLTLTAEEKETLRQWIAEGAHYEGHWAFRSLAPESIPKPSDRRRVRNEIDAFVQAQLEKQGWHLGEEASKERLIRRVTFDLTGLPPTVSEIDAFIADTSPSAYEDLLDRLLRSERYGERMAAEWLDVARYSDSYGYQVDRDRYVWPWRDWVIRAFNENLPYDQFVTWQLAGDLLPNASRDQILATTFNRLHSQKVEGGSVPEEFRIEYVADRAHTFGTAFLGLTLECSRCHDHKYDPISQKEYYQLSAFFANIEESGLYSYFTSSVPTPTLVLTNEEQEAKQAELESAISVAESSLYRNQQEVDAFSGHVAHYSFDERVVGKFPNLVDEKISADSSSANALIAGKQGQAIQLTGDDAVNLKVGNFNRNQPFTIACWISTPDVKERAVIFHRSRAWTDAASRGYEALLLDGHLQWSLIHFWPGNAISIRTRDPLPVASWVHIGVSYDGSSRADGLQIWVNGKPAVIEVVQDDLYKNITGGGGDHIVIGQRFRDRGFSGGAVDEMHVFDRQLAPSEISFLAGITPRPDGVAIAGSATQHQDLQALRGKRSQLVDGIQEIMVMREKTQPRQSYLLNRGAYDARDVPVEPNTPAILPPMKEPWPRNRLGLARWITDPEQPLTARVTVNRYWQMFFGKGLVGTPEDFGIQGAAATHPRLLDWLAHDFMKGGWDLKSLVMKMVLSQTYRQQSNATPEQESVDPLNTWLARAPRYRLSAEMVRDNLLYASGLLVEKIGGPPAKPYEVAASFKPVAHEKGAGLYRRSLYTYWKRTSPAPVMIALDAPKRDVCMVKREVTATPLQAFVYMNDPQAVEAARTLSGTLIQRHGEHTGSLLTELFRRLTSRQPESRESEILQSMYSAQLDHFKTRPKQAAAFLKTGESPIPEEIDPTRLAALTAVTTSLLAYDDCVMKR